VRGVILAGFGRSQGQSTRLLQSPSDGATLELNIMPLVMLGDVAVRPCLPDEQKRHLSDLVRAIARAGPTTSRPFGSLTRCQRKELEQRVPVPGRGGKAQLTLEVVERQLRPA
jgi:hypothetical protein